MAKEVKLSKGIKSEVIGGKPIREINEREVKSLEDSPSQDEYPRDSEGRFTRGLPQDTNKNGLAGRSTKYKPEYAEMLIDFMSRTSHEVGINRTYYKGTGDSTGGIKGEKHVVITETYPTLHRFAFNIGVHIDTLYAWEKATYPEDTKEVDEEGKSLAGKLKYPEFSEALRIARQIQESILVENALSGNYSSQFAMFIAKNNFGYKDKTEVETKGTIKLDLSSLTDEELSALIEKDSESLQ